MAHIEALSYTAGEYEQVVLATDAASKAPGRSRTDREFSNLTLGMGWAESASLALLAGEHGHMGFNPRMVVSKRPSSGVQFGPRGRAKGSRASEQTVSRMVERYNSYVRDLGLHKQKVSTRDPKAMNRVLNFYREITAYYLDLTEGRQPPSHVQFKQVAQSLSS